MIRIQQNTRRRNVRQSYKSTPRSGALTVEFALVAPIIFMIFFGCLELTCLNLMRHTAGNAAYEAARAGIVPGASETAAKQKAQNLLNAVGATRNVTIDFLDTASKVTVTIRIPVKDNSWGLARFSGSTTIEKKCVLTREK
ncbi:MAG: TadE/TadG family type IV pilus assembly protein [Fuerstiella sp.]